MLQPPFFDPNGPDYLNYGSLGVMITHGILHGFDQHGRRYDEQGKHNIHWWSNETRSTFDTAASCLEDQYSEFNISSNGSSNNRNKKENDSHFPVNGKQTLDGNLADLGGLLQAYATWKKYGNTNKLLPGLDKWTREQLFYINFARMRCSKSTVENDLQEVCKTRYLCYTIFQGLLINNLLILFPILFDCLHYYHLVTYKSSCT